CASRRRLRRLRPVAATAKDPYRTARQDEAHLSRRHPEPRKLARVGLPDQHGHWPGQRAAPDRRLGAARIDHAGGVVASVHEHGVRERAGRSDAGLVADQTRGREILPGGGVMRRTAVLIALMLASGLVANRALAMLQTRTTAAALISTTSPQV